MATNKTTTLSSIDAPASLTEYLSAVLDGEAGGFEERRVLDELKSNKELQHKLFTYSLISETMRSDAASVTASTDFLAGIHQKISAEDEYHHVNVVTSDKEKTASSWLRPVGGFALAASVAAISIIGFQNYQQTSQNGFVTASSDNAASTLLDNSMIKASQIANNDSQLVNDKLAVPDLYKQADNRTRLFLKRFVDSHLQQASNSAFVPSVRVIAYAD